jgi:predicted metal-dependent phosphoesterase TrpH
MIEFRADLHCHTTCSDGTTTPEDIIKLAHTKGLSGLSITDHDTIEAYKTAMPAAKTYQIDLISGVEFSALHRETSVHILAYSFPLNSPLIEEFCLKHHQQREQRNHEILNLLTSYGMPLTQGEIHRDPFSNQTIGRPHIALAMVKKGYVSSIQEAFNKYIGEDKPCYAMGHYFSVEDTIELIHQAKGLAVIAHPHLIDDSQILQDLIHMNFDGIEGYYGRFPSTDHERWIKIGQRRGWLITGGSDFHGDIKPNLPLGASWINEETFRILQKHFQKNESI